jgi:YesN/AraC family two-component response regulator
MEKYNILLVDDEQNILKALRRLFREEHVNILTASSASEALEIFKQQSIQLIISDNLMPGMTGVELINKVREISPDTIRIILSGHSDIEAILNAVNQGEAYRFILKPWNDIDLRLTINIALAQYKLIDDNKNLKKDLLEKTRLLENLRRNHPEIFNLSSSDDSYNIKEYNISSSVKEGV